MELIDKDAVVEEIERRIQLFSEESGKFNSDIEITLFGLEFFLNTLEVKEVDLDSNIKAYLTNHFNVYEDGVLQSKKSSRPLSTYDIIKVAKYFFELGIAESKKA